MSEAPAGNGLETREALGLGLLLILAAVLRLHDLGAIGFSGPEDYVVLAARGILEHGWPELPSGAVYPRALPYSYLVAASVAVLGESELAVRLPGALLSVAGVGMAWALARLAFGPAVALLAGLVMAGSDWEILMGRTARMYGPLAVSGLALVWLSARSLVYGPRAGLAWSVVVGALTGAMHRLALSLVAAIALLPILPGRALPARARLALPAIALVAVALLANAYTDRTYAVRAELYAAVHGETAQEIARDSAPAGLPGLTSTSLGVLAAIALLAAGTGALVGRRAGLAAAVASAGAFVALALGRPLLAGYVWLGLASLAAWRRDAGDGRALVGLAIAIAAGTLAWLGWLVFQGSAPLDACRELLLRPRHFLLFHVLRAPGVVALAGVATLRLALEPTGGGRNEARWLLAAACLLPASLLGLHPQAETNFHERYAFLLDPYLLILYAAGVWWVATRSVEWLSSRMQRPTRRVAIAGALRVAIAGVLLLSTGGIDPRASLAAASPHYGTNPDLRSARGQPRFFADHVATARFVCDHAGPDDRIVVTDALGHALYCPRLDHQITVQRGLDADLWLGGSRNRASLSDLLGALASDPGERVWFVVSQEEWQLRRRTGRLAELESLLAAPCVERAHRSRDGLSSVYVWDGSCRPGAGAPGGEAVSEVTYDGATKAEDPTGSSGIPTVAAR